MNKTYQAIGSEKNETKSLTSNGLKLASLLLAIFSVFSAVTFYALRYTSLGAGVDIFEHLPYAIMSGVVAVSFTFSCLLAKDI